MHSVKLIHSTPGGDYLVAYMARVSNPKNQNNTETSARLIKYLITHKHWSPFEMVNMCVSIETTRSISQQIIRHRSFSFQEFSQRYAQVQRPSVVPDLREQDTKNRQNSTDTLDPSKVQALQRKVQDLYAQSVLLYNEMLGEGVAKECARDVLLLSTPTQLFMNGTLRSWLHYCDLRCANSTQKEHRDIANKCKELIFQRFPMAYEAFFNNPGS